MRLSNSTLRFNAKPKTVPEMLFRNDTPGVFRPSSDALLFVECRDEMICSGISGVNFLGDPPTIFWGVIPVGVSSVENEVLLIPVRQCPIPESLKTRFPFFAKGDSAPVVQICCLSVGGRRTSLFGTTPYSV